MQNTILKFDSKSSAEDWLIKQKSQVVELTWKRGNFAKIIRAERLLAEISEGENRMGDPDFTNGIIDGLFGKSNSQLGLVQNDKVKLSVIDLALIEFRPNILKITSEGLEKLVRNLCIEACAEEIESKRSEVYTFLRQCLETNPPLYWDTRWYWISVVIKRHNHYNMDHELIGAVAAFSKKCRVFLKNNTRAPEYMHFLLSLFEWDYAIVQAKVKNAPKKFRNLIVKDGRDDLDQVPLAFLVVAKINELNMTITEEPQDSNVYIDLTNYWCTGSESQRPMVKRIFARMLGLILDSLLFWTLRVDQKLEVYENLTSVDQVPNKVSKVFARVRKQFDEDVFREVASLSNVRWIKELSRLG